MRHDVMKNREREKDIQSPNPVFCDRNPIYLFIYFYVKVISMYDIYAGVFFFLLVVFPRLVRSGSKSCLLACFACSGWR